MNAVKNWRGKISKMLGWIKPHTCPIPGCKYHWRLRDGLEAHLYNKHLKAELSALADSIGAKAILVGRGQPPHYPIELKEILT